MTLFTMKQTTNPSTKSKSAQTSEYERLLAASDNEIFDWVSGLAAVPPEADSPVLRKLKAFRVRF